MENTKLKQVFIGTWKGTDKGTLNEDETNNWLVTRTNEGLFFVEFTTYFRDGTIEKSSEKGLWYVEDDLFYEQRDGEDEADIYTYKVLSEKLISFKDTISSYQFTDEKILLN